MLHIKGTTLAIFVWISTSFRNALMAGLLA